MKKSPPKSHLISFYPQLLSKHFPAATLRLMTNMLPLHEELELRAALPEPEERRRIRLQAGVSQAAIARACGVTPACVCLWEGGRRQPRGRNLRAYVEVLRLLAGRAGSGRPRRRRAAG
jgi:DNA-binding transcriptional regulator YiaG